MNARWTPGTRRDPPWLLAPVLLTLLREIDAAWPTRSRASDGALGDREHAKRRSDHNPDQRGYVRALDITYDRHAGPPMDALADYLRRIGKSQSQRLIPGGYVIWDRKITSSRTGWDWIAYTGESPHTRHLHVSCSLLPPFYLARAPWHVIRLATGSAAGFP